MKAIVCRKYGSPDALRLEEIEKPIPGDDEVSIKIHAASLNAADLHLLRADPFLIRLYSGLLRPKFKVLGADIAGRVEAIGRSVLRFKPGDEVFGDLSVCGWGGLAQYARAPEGALAPKPANLSFEEAAAAPMAAVTALQGLRDKGCVRAGHRVLINGASGGVGTYAIQIAKYFGAEVSAVCSARNLDMARSIGADHVIDYALEDFTRNGREYDLILAANGYHSIYDYKRALSPQGSYVMTGGTGAQMLQAMLLGPWLSMKGGRRMGSLSAVSNRRDLAFLHELLEAGEVKPVIDRRYRLSEAAEAFRYLEEGHARGKIVIAVE